MEETLNLLGSPDYEAIRADAQRLAHATGLEYAHASSTEEETAHA